MPIGVGHLHRVDGVLASFREVEVIIKGGGGVRPQLYGPALGVFAILQRNGALGHLHQKLKLLRGRGRVGDHHLASVADLLEKLVGHEVVQPLVAHVAVARVSTEKVLAKQNLSAFLDRLAWQDFLVANHHVLTGGELKGAILGLGHVLGLLKRQVNHRQGKHHLGKVAGGINEVTTEEGLVGGAGRVVIPEGVHPHEVGILLGDGELVVIVLGPFLGGRKLAEKLTGLSTLL